MAEVNYLNPAAFIPPNEFKASGPLGGVLLGRQIDDYNKIMEQQLFLQDLAKKRASIETNEFEQAGPLRQMQREGQMETLGGQMPYLRNMAGAQALRDTAGANYDTAVKYGPEAKAFDLLKLTEGVDDIKKKNFLGSVVQAGEIANQAQTISDMQGETAALGYVTKQLEAARKAGHDIPDHAILNPDMWPSLRRAGIDSLKHMQEMEKEQYKGTVDLERTQITADAARDNAQIRAGATGNKPQNMSEAQYFTWLARIPKDQRTEEQQKHYDMLADTLWSKQVDKLIGVAIMSKEKLDPAKIQQMKQNFLRNGDEASSSTPDSTGGNSQPQGLPPGSRLIGHSPDGAEIHEAPNGQRYKVRK